MKLLRDLFQGPGNNGWELARFLGAYAVLSYSATFIVPLIRNGNVSFDYSSLGIGYAAILAGSGAFVWAKDTARTAAISQVKQDATAASAPTGPQEVQVMNKPEDAVPVTGDAR